MITERSIAIIVLKCASWGGRGVGEGRGRAAGSFVENLRLYKSLLLLIMRSRVRFPVLLWEFFLAGKFSRGDYGLGS